MSGFDAEKNDCPHIPDESSLLDHARAIDHDVGLLGESLLATQYPEQYQCMNQDETLAEQWLTHIDGHYRESALLFVVHRSLIQKSVVSKIYAICSGDEKMHIRIMANYTLGALCIANQDEQKLAFLAKTALNESEIVEVRKAAYRSLVLATPDLRAKAKNFRVITGSFEASDFDTRLLNRHRRGNRDAGKHS